MARPKGSHSVKEPITVRLSVESKEGLTTLAGEQSRTVSSLVNQAVGQFLGQDGGGLPGFITEEKKVAEIMVLLQVQRLRELGSEKYMDELKTVTENFKIPDEEMLTVLTAVFYRAWQMPPQNSL